MFCLLLVISFFTFYFNFIKAKKSTTLLMHPLENRWFILIFAITFLLILTVTTANSGISVRQKWMLMLKFFVFFYLFMRINLTYRVYRLRSVK
jgi:hypothetical protein